MIAAPSWRRVAVLSSLTFLVACAGKPVRQEAPVVAGNQRGGVPEGQTLRVERSLRVTPGEYLRRPLGEEGTDGVIRLEGLSDVVLDLRDVELYGTARASARDAATGYGIVVTGCDNVQILGGRIGGYKACIVIEDSDRVTVDGTQFDGWFGQRLYSTLVAEDPADWLAPHENERGEWVAEGGAAIAITDSTRIVVKNCVGRHGQNGVLMTRAGGCELYDNDFSFLSGWGLALFRSSRNVVGRNRFDYCVRGFSDRHYATGQNSAGIVLCERSSENVVALNSATNCGNGIYVFGGNDVVEGRAFERGELDAGGCDDNLFYRNDLRNAVSASLVVRFSRDNRVVENLLGGSRRFGLWASYCSGLTVLRNTVRGTIGGAVSLEHSQDCYVVENELADNDIGVEVWWDAQEDHVQGPYGQHRDTSSRSHWIVANRFVDNLQDLVFKDTTALYLADNAFQGGSRGAYVNGLVSAGRAPDVEQGETVESWLNGADGSRPSGHLAASTLLPPETDARAVEDARIVAPPAVPGTKDFRGEAAGDLATIVVGEWGPWDFESGEPRPQQRRPGGVLAGAQWDAAWFRWDTSVDPRGDLEAWRALKFRPLAREEVDSWFSPWPTERLREVVGLEHFGLIARAEVQIRESGRYRLKVVSDDGVRVHIDGEVVFEDWTWHPSRQDEVEVTLKQGRHTFEVEYFQIDGAAALSLDLEAL